MAGLERHRHDWDPDELTLALFYYCQIPFAKTKQNNPVVIALAERLSRTPASVARKLGNFGAFDPALAARGISGLVHGSALDREIWDRYRESWDVLVDRAQSLLSSQRLAGTTDERLEPGADESRPGGDSESVREVRVRRHQAFFRRAILAGYRERCTVCGLDIPDLLNASHIVPWAADASLRTDPQNGLCLCSIHDRAFDRGLMGVDGNGLVVLSNRLRSRVPVFASVFQAFEGAKIAMPDRFQPKPEHLMWRMRELFNP